MRAIYDLAWCPLTYDFVAFLTAARNEAATRGEPLSVEFVLAGTETGFRKGKFQDEWKAPRFKRILQALCDSQGIPWSIKTKAGWGGSTYPESQPGDRPEW